MHNTAIPVWGEAHGCVAYRMGRWKDAVTANVRAYRADVAFTQHCLMPYAPEHNTDMLIYAANMAGMVRCMTP